MPQSLTRLLTHVTFSTKRCRPLISAKIKDDLQSYLGGVLRKLDSPCMEVNCVEDHVHLLFPLSRKIALADLLKELKGGSSKWIKTKGAEWDDFFWQGGYGAFSVSPSNAAIVQEYIRRQAEHHRKMTFQEEFRRLLEKHGIEYDERYVWD